MRKNGVTHMTTAGNKVRNVNIITICMGALMVGPLGPVERFAPSSGPTAPPPPAPAGAASELPTQSTPSAAVRRSAKGTAAGRQTGEELADSSGGTLDIVPVLRVFPRSAKGAAAGRQTGEKLAGPSGGALDTVPVLRVFLRSAKGAAAGRQTGEELASSSGGALDTVPVLRVFPRNLIVY